MKAAHLWLLAGLLLLPYYAQGQTKPDHPDIFLITIDTLRADHVHCYGYKNVDTPAMDGLAADGVRFDQAFTPAPITNSSHATILTGLLPSAHGVTDFGVLLAPTHKTWAELLKQSGYQTAAFIGAVILDSNTLAPGLNRGFRLLRQFSRASAGKVAMGPRGAAWHGRQHSCAKVGDGTSARASFFVDASL